jgi:hypothetical protein
MPLTSLFGYVAAATLVGAAILAVLVKPIRELATKGTKSTTD